MSEKLDEEIELLAAVAWDAGGDLHAQPEEFPEPLAAVKRVKVKKSELRETLEKLAATARELVEGWSMPRVRLDEVSFTLQVGADGLLKWIMGVGLSGAATVKFKIDPPAAVPGGTVPQSSGVTPGK